MRITAKHYLWAAVVVMILTIAAHSYGWTMVGAKFGAMKGFARLLWFVAALDWLTCAILWGFAAYRNNGAWRLPVLISLIIPFGAAIGLLITVGPGFFGLWMIVLAGGLAGYGANRLD